MSQSVASNPDSLSFTRIANACVLIEMNHYAVLTDPWFKNPWGFNEEPGLMPEQLPILTAVIGSHFATDHWEIAALGKQPNRDKLPVLTATEGMAKEARKLRFRSARRMSWGEKLEVAPNLTIEAVQAQAWCGLRSNNYVLSSANRRVFFGGELKDLQSLRSWRRDNPAVDVVLAPANGMRLFGVSWLRQQPRRCRLQRFLGRGL